MTAPQVSVHLIDGTFELFRAYFGAPRATGAMGSEVGASRGLLRSLVKFIHRSDVGYVAVAFDHVIESFRNRLFSGYKTGEGIEPDLRCQFELAERVARALGLVTWAMVEYEADDALATAARRFSCVDGVDQVVICSPDKDLCQCVSGTKVVTYDSIRRTTRDEAGVRAKFGVAPVSLPDWLALVGDSADGIPGIPRWGAKSASAVLAFYETIDAIPEDSTTWKVKVRGAAALAENLNQRRAQASMYRSLATLREDVPLAENLDDLRWRGARRRELAVLCRELGADDVMERISVWRDE